MRSFASDNNAGVHPRILEALSKANQDHAIAYGDDRYTEGAVQKFREHFGKDIEVFFVFNGTAANTLALSAMTKPFQAIICADSAHIQVDECAAPEKFIGCKLIPISTENGKLGLDVIQKNIVGLGDQHHVQTKVIAISQTTEYGTVYTVQEVRALAEFAHEQNMFLFMDGARLANAAARLNLSLKEITKDLGVDVLTFGGTKNGMMYGEAIIFFNRALAADFKFIRKQGMQLSSKMRFISAQFEAMLSDELWLKNAKHANEMAQLLLTELKDIPQIKITRPVDANGIFACLPPAAVKKLKEKWFFYVIHEATSEVRWMTSFDTREEDVRNFVSNLRTALA